VKTVNQDDAKALDALALAALPEKAMIARLASIKYAHAAPSKRPLDARQAKAIILATFPERGGVTRLVKAFHDECYRQEKIHNERKAIKDGLALLARPYTQQPGARFDRIAEKNRHAKLMFGDYIRSAFSADILSLMELTSGDCRSYRVDFLDVGVRPALSATVTITLEGAQGTFQEYFLLYKEPGTSKAHAVFTVYAHGNVKDAWAWQVPHAARALRGLGYGFRTDFVTQEMVATGPNGDEQRLQWRGKPVANG
jgi:hypothetical protein